MSNKDKGFQGDVSQRAESWFNRTNDDLPFDAFGNNENEIRIGNEIFNKVNQQIHGGRTVRLIFLRYAAAVLLVATAGLALSRYLQPAVPGKNQTEWTTFTAAGEEKTVRLPDSSIVMLRPGAKLVAPASFAEGNRTVKLSTGEAYFTVTRDKKHPFIVQSGAISIKVLGTAFNIKHALKRNEIEVAVSHGKVQVNDQAHRLAYLRKGELITYNTKSGLFRLDTINTSAVAAWSHQSADLNNAAFRELAYVFMSYYGMELMAADPDIAELRYTLTINKSSAALSTLKIITKIHGLYFKEQNGKIVLYK